MKANSPDGFGRPTLPAAGMTQHALPQRAMGQEVGPFGVFTLKDLFERLREKPVMPYDPRVYYKISLISGHSRAEYANQIIDINTQALLFATPRIPYHWLPHDFNQSGQFCIFTNSFLLQTKREVVLDELPIFRAGGCPVFEVSDADCAEIGAIFNKMEREMASGYAYKDDLLGNYVLELIHFGQKLQPAPTQRSTHNASARVTALFMELLERQFPIQSLQQTQPLRTAKDYADRLALHINHLNKVLKETTGRTTTELINGRVIQEAKALLTQTNWTISEISDSLGFTEVAHFSNFFKRQTSVSPGAFRLLAIL